MHASPAIRADQTMRWSQSRTALPRAQVMLLTAILFVAVPVAAYCGTLHVPSEYPAIQAAIDAASPGDSIIVAPEQYTENLDTGTKQLYLISQSGPDVTIIDGGYHGSVVIFRAGGTLSGFTIRHGRDISFGGIVVLGASPVRIEHNIIEDNIAGYRQDFGAGGGIALPAGTSGCVISENIIRNNYAGDSGGGVYELGEDNQLVDNRIENNGCHVCGGGAFNGGIIRGNLILRNWADSFGAGLCGGGVEVTNNTIVLNYNINMFRHGAGIHVLYRPRIENNIVALNHGWAGSSAGVGILCANGSLAVLGCNDSWGNDGGDYEGCDIGDGSNVSADPLFCDLERGEYTIGNDSPCRPGGVSGCGLIGAFPVACGATATARTTWGRVKALYR